MSKTSMCIQMLQILYSRNVVGIAELADMLETNPRNIPEYKKELEMAGYYIKTIPGRYGGYSLEKRHTFPSVKLEDEEKEALMRGYDYLLSRSDFMEKKKLGKAMAKLSAALMQTEVTQNTLIANRFPLSMSQEELERRYQSVALSVASKKIMEIEYLALDNQVTKRKIHPYKLFMYNNAWFVLGFDEMSRDIRYFKLNRIQNFVVTNEAFRVMYTYNERDYLDEYGMKKNGEWYPIKLKLTGSYAMLVKERTYGKNQTVEALDSETTILSVEMQNKENITSFVLGFGTNCEVLEPEWLREKVKSACVKILEY